MLCSYRNVLAALSLPNKVCNSICSKLVQNFKPKTIVSCRRPVSWRNQEWRQFSSGQTTSSILDSRQVAFPTFAGSWISVNNLFCKLCYGFWHMSETSKIPHWFLGGRPHKLMIILFYCLSDVPNVRNYPFKKKKVKPPYNSTVSVVTYDFFKSGALVTHILTFFGPQMELAYRLVPISQGPKNSRIPGLNPPSHLPT